MLLSKLRDFVRRVIEILRTIVFRRLLLTLWGSEWLKTLGIRKEHQL